MDTPLPQIITTEKTKHCVLLSGELQATDVIVRMGRLEITTRGPTGNKIAGPCDISVLHDGKPLLVRHLELIFDIHQLPYIKLEYYP